MKKLLNEAEWGKLTESRLKRSGVNRAEWDRAVKALHDSGSLSVYAAFAKRMGILIDRDRRRSYKERVIMGVESIILAIESKSEEDFRAKVNQEIRRIAELVEEKP